MKHKQQREWRYNMTGNGPLVAVVGMGKIGLPLDVQYAQHGKRVIGCDINPQVVEMVNAGQSHVQEEPELADAVPELVQRGLLSATVNTTEAVWPAAIVVVLVPVVVNAEAQPNFSSICPATKSIWTSLPPCTLSSCSTA